MADNQKYYYMRLKEDFFNSNEIVLLEAMPDGYLYSNILLKLYLKSLKDNGKLMFNERIPYNAQMIAAITGHQIGTVEKALKFFLDMGLIEILDSGAIYMLDIQQYIGKSSTESDRKREYRRRIEAEKSVTGQIEDKCPENVTEMSGQCPLEIDIELEKEIKTDIELNRERDYTASNEANTSVNPLDGMMNPPEYPGEVEEKPKKKKPTKHKHGEYKNVLLTDEELEKLKDRFPDWEDRIERLSLYIESKGACYKSHYATILSWARREDGQGQKTAGKGKYEPYRGNRTADMLQDSYDMLKEWAKGE